MVIGYYYFHFFLRWVSDIYGSLLLHLIKKVFFFSFFLFCQKNVEMWDISSKFWAYVLPFWLFPSKFWVYIQQFRFFSHYDYEFSSEFWVCILKFRLFVSTMEYKTKKKEDKVIRTFFLQLRVINLFQFSEWRLYILQLYINMHIIFKPAIRFAELRVYILFISCKFRIFAIQRKKSEL